MVIGDNNRPHKDSCNNARVLLPLIHNHGV